MKRRSYWSETNLYDADGQLFRSTTTDGERHLVNPYFALAGIACVSCSNGSGGNHATSQ